MSYPLNIPTPTGLAPLRHQTALVQAAQYLEGSGPTMAANPDNSPLDGIASGVAAGVSTGTVTLKHGQKGPAKHG
jgi:hypothetical protein